jgi:hypothetical protein
LSGPRLPLIEDTSATRTERIAVEPAVQVHRVVRPLYGGLTEGYVAWLSGDLRNSTVAAWAAVVEAQEAAEATYWLRQWSAISSRETTRWSRRLHRTQILRRARAEKRPRESYGGVSANLISRKGDTEPKYESSWIRL